MNYQEVKTLKQQVYYCLERWPDTRNSDITLMIQVWITFYPNQTIGGECSAVRFCELYDLPREDNVKRVRAHLQNDKHLFPPTLWEVARQRGYQEDEWRTALGYPTKATARTPTPSWIPPSLQTPVIEETAEEKQTTLFDFINK